MQTTKDRLKSFLRHKNISQGKFAESIGVSKGYVNNMTENPTQETINKIMEKFSELNIDWLLNGKGIMIRENNQNIKSDTINGGNFNTGDNPVFNPYPITEEAIKNASQGYQDIIKTYQVHMGKLLTIIENLTLKYEK
jgi:transcriptional regulator with XRE-family HTH domain